VEPASGPLIDQRAVVDPSFLELVRHGVFRPDDPGIPNTLTVVHQQLGYTTPNGPFWHRASLDGYGETNDGSEWEPTPSGSGLTFGRGWPLLTGERGEYQLAPGSQAQNNLDTMTRSGDDQSFLLPERGEPRSLGRTRGSSGSPGPSTRARRSRRRNRSPAAIQAQSAVADFRTRAGSSYWLSTTTLVFGLGRRIVNAPRRPL
jgi:glucoamylase